jgi:4-amino-4-deoxy-L-arabinose transferase-like glycosyltransferase
MRTPSRRAAWLAPLLIFALALAPRLWALGWGLPYVEHADEPALVEVAMRMVQRGDWNPGRFLYPSLHFTMLAAVIRLHLAWGMARGLYAALDDLPSKTYLFTTAPALYVWARALTGLLGAATAPLLYELGRRMFGWRVGLLAAAALALSTYHIQHSHFITTDVPTGLWVTLALLGAWGAATDGRWRGYLLAGAASGLAAGTKYNAGVVGLALARAAVIFCLDARRAARASLWPTARAQGLRLIVAGALALLVFLATTPYAVLDFAAFRRDMLISTTHYASGSHGNFVGRLRLDGYLAFIWAEGLLPTGSLIALAGLPLLIRRAPRQAALLASAVIACGGLLLTQAVNFNRNTLPIFPPLFLLAAAGAVALGEWACARLPRRAGRLALPLLAALLLAPQAYGSAWLLRYWSQPYTLQQAAEALQAQPRGMLAAVELNPVQLAGDPVAVPVNFLASYPADWYRARGYRFLVLNADKYGAGDAAAYQQVLGYGPQILRMPERDLGLQPGPGGALIDLGEHPELMPFARRAASFGGQIGLLGYELAPGEPRARILPLDGADARALPPGQPVQINLYWRALAPMGLDYSLFVHVVDAAGATVAQRDLPLRYADYPTSRWRPGELVIDRADMPLPALPPGEYRFEIGLYDTVTGAALPAEGGAPVVLTTVTVGGP